MDKVLPLPEVEAISKATDCLAIGDKAIDYPIHGKTIEDKADNLSGKPIAWTRHRAFYNFAPD